ncbi:MAG TPA: MarR family transcriptional regulator [Methylomirabilota bacterium]|jgi:DNA-binding MarR family transcriptional regulator|nr:MarR family transcriptional regulator [Methylomirabilota bacterium]
MELDYRLEEQVGFLLRRATQRHVAIFAEHMGEEVTPTRWAVLAKLHETGPSSQNRLGRLTAMDAATIKGVVDRLIERSLIETRPDPQDARRRVIALSEAGRRLVERSVGRALAITRETLDPLTPAERAELMGLLRKLG